MKKILSSLLVLVAFTAFAQTPAAPKAPHEPKTPEQRATVITAHLEKNLTLTADEKTKVHDLALAREQKIDQLREANKGKDRCAWADQRKQAMSDFDAGMKSTLTPDQYSKWTAQKEERHKQMEAHHHGSTKTPEERATGMANHLEKDLGLTADQKTKVHDLALTKEQANDQLRDKYKGQDPCAWQSERKQVRDHFEDGMKSTLTPEQYQKWQDQKKQRMEQHMQHHKAAPTAPQQGK